MSINIPPEELLKIAQGRRVLLVEDDSINQKVASRLFSKFGCQPDIASNGKEAVDKAAAGGYDLVFMDCQMPVMDGYEATRRIRQLPNGASIIIVAMTAHAMQGDRDRCVAAGMDDFISKPVKLEDIHLVLQRNLSQGHQL